MLYAPELIQQILVAKQSSFNKGPAFKRTFVLKNPTSLTSDGDDHRRMRKLVHSSFRGSYLKEYAKEMIQDTIRMQAKWNEGKHFRHRFSDAQTDT